jgi:hypothetical protein
VEKEIILDACDGVIIRPWQRADVAELVMLANDRDVWINLRDVCLFKDVCRRYFNFFRFDDSDQDSVNKKRIVCGAAIGLIFFNGMGAQV